MTYKVIRNAAGEAVCFGPNDNNYEPTIAAGNVLTIEATVPSPSQAELKAAANAPILAQLAINKAEFIDAMMCDDVASLAKCKAAHASLRRQLQ